VRYLPIELDVAGREALVVGAGRETAAKIARLIEAGARVTVVASGPVDGPLREDRRVVLHERALEDTDLETPCVVFVEPGDDALSQRLHAWGVRTGRPVCTLDRPELSTFANPAVVEVSGLTIAFGAGGASPGTLRRIREDLGALFADERLGRWLDALRTLRERLPHGARGKTMAAAVRGFGIDARLRFPPWFERGEEPPAD
jgi:precorrin-2 dehydrogenase/sirohydrochlorin ferrochelatase